MKRTPTSQEFCVPSSFLSDIFQIPFFQLPFFQIPKNPNMPSFIAWKFSPDSSCIQTVRGNPQKFPEFLREHLQLGNREAYSIFLNPTNNTNNTITTTTKFMIYHERQKYNGSPYNRPAHQTFKHLKLTWHQLGENQAFKDQNPYRGVFLVVQFTKKDPYSPYTPANMNFAGPAQWIHHINHNMKHELQKENKWSRSVKSVADPKPETGHLKKLAEATDARGAAEAKTMADLAFLAVRGALKSEATATCPISWDPLQSLTDVFVGGCGHIFGPEILNIRTKECPLCRKPSECWSVVEVSKAALANAMETAKTHDWEVAADALLACKS